MRTALPPLIYEKIISRLAFGGNNFIELQSVPVRPTYFFASLTPGNSTRQWRSSTTSWLKIIHARQYVCKRLRAVGRYPT